MALKFPGWNFLRKHWLDLMLYLAVLALAVTGLCLLPVFFSSGEAHVLNVNVDGTIVKTVDLARQQED